MSGVLLSNLSELCLFSFVVIFLAMDEKCSFNPLAIVWPSLVKVPLIFSALIVFEQSVLLDSIFIVFQIVLFFGGLF